jgi:outer membrane protein insertion porin family
MLKKYKIFLTTFFIVLISFNLHTKEIVFKGINNLKLEDLQTLSNIDIYSKNFDELLVNELIRDLYRSILIEDISYELQKDKYLIQIEESFLINEIFINGNLQIDDDIFIENFINKKDLFLNKENIQSDVKLIRNLYESKGYQSVNINVVTEKINNSKINLIFNVAENKPSNIFKISFSGNKFFSDRFISSKILSKEKSTFNIFKTGSNLNQDIFNFDNKLIEGLYIDNGFFDVKSSYELVPYSDYNYFLNFFIEEGPRIKIDSIDTSSLTGSVAYLLEKNFKELNKMLTKQDFYYDANIINNFILSSNEELYDSNIYELFVEAKIEFIDNKNILKIYSQSQLPFIINKIEIIGNDITKDKTIRSKIDFEPGDVINDKILLNAKNKISNLEYIINTNISSIKNNNNSNDIIFELDENKKTGSVNFAGSVSGDTGLGVGFNINDKNIQGSGNELDFSINLNSERALFDFTLMSTSKNNSNIKNEYSIFNSDLDLTNSFGFKSREFGFRYGLNFQYSKNSSISSSLSFKNSEGYANVNNISAVYDNIGNFTNFEINTILNFDTTNDVLYPTSGNSFLIGGIYSPKGLSDNSYYKITLRNDNYFQISENKNYFFLINNLGTSGSEEGKLKTINTFSLGGLNFKGFDYRGIGKFDENIYLGGNNLITSTFGYGGDFIFDERDNINYKIFYSTGSIWDSDYSSNDDFNLRSSIGISLDIFTPVAPISLSYAVPVEYNSSDKIRRFNFILGTSF